MRTRGLPLLLTGLLALAACGDDDAAPTGPTASGTPSASAGPTPSAAGTPAPAESDVPAAGPAFGEPSQRAEQAGSPEAPGLSVVDVRVGQHEGYDRLVLELGGQGTAGWRVAYEDDPRTEGAGDPVDLDGDATLVVRLDGVGYPFDTGVEEYGGPRRFSPQAAVLREVQVGGVFEGTFDAFVGIAGERPFRVFRLDSPQRVVLDVAHGD